MVELVFAFGVIVLAVSGLALGLAFGKGPVRTSCGSVDRLPGERCEDCPLWGHTHAREQMK